MNKGELVEALSKKANMSKTQAGEVLDSLLDTIVSNLKKGKEVNITGFGNFSVQHRNSRKGRNPQTGEELTIPARDVPKFKAVKNLKEAVK